MLRLNRDVPKERRVGRVDELLDFVRLFENSIMFDNMISIIDSLI